MAARLKPQLVEIGPACTIGCSLSPRKLPIADIVTQWYSAGNNNLLIRERAMAAGYTISIGAINRHRRAHLVLSSDDAIGVIRDAELGGGPDDRVDHVKVLEAIIARGARSIHTWRVGPDMTIKAMDMWYRLTQGNAQQSWMDEMAAAIAAAGEGEPGRKGGSQVATDELARMRDADDPGQESESETEVKLGAA